MTSWLTTLSSSSGVGHCVANYRSRVSAPASGKTLTRCRSRLSRAGAREIFDTRVTRARLVSRAPRREPVMASSLIRGKYVVAKVASRHDAEVIADGAVFQRDGVIVDVGSYAVLAARHQADEVLGSPDHVVVPGFVNGHHHVGLTPFQLGSPDYPLELWFASRLAARAVDPYLDTLYSAFEMLESGITTVQHLHGWRGAPASRVREIADRILQA